MNRLMAQGRQARRKASLHPRIVRERRTVAAMIRIHCRDHHGTRRGLCPACAELQDYAWNRLGKCPFQGEKPTCARCTIHCYRPDRRETIRAVMRYAGPRMLFRHPLLALDHMVRELRSRGSFPQGAGAHRR